MRCWCWNTQLSTGITTGITNTSVPTGVQVGSREFGAVTRSLSLYQHLKPWATTSRGFHDLICCAAPAPVLQNSPKGSAKAFCSKIKALTESLWNNGKAGRALRAWAQVGQSKTPVFQAVEVWVPDLSSPIHRLSVLDISTISPPIFPGKEFAITVYIPSTGTKDNCNWWRDKT